MRRLVGIGAAAAVWLLGPGAALAQPALADGDAQAIVDALRDAPQQGLPAVEPPDPSDAAALARAAVSYALDEHGRIRDPESVDPNFALRAPYDADGAFARAVAAHEVADWLARQTRSDPGYLALVAARGRYAGIVEAGGWPALPGGAALSPGGRDERVPQLRQRLAAEGYGDGADPGPGGALVFEPSLSALLADFQAHHGLSATGALDDATLEALNVSAQARLDAIDANLERERWLPVQLPPTRIVADIGGPVVRLYENDQMTLEMRAVAGEPPRPTPIFASRVTGVEFNPPWVVPQDIAARELWPRQRKDPGYFRDHDFVASRGRLVQRSGPQSSLGYVKFDLPDKFEVYLHDTPERADFDRAARFTSHGCVRLERPRELAAALLGWTPDEVDQAIDAKATHIVALKAPTPVFLVYRTAQAGDDGKVTFRPDVYGWDAEISDALAGRPPAETHAATDAAP